MLNKSRISNAPIFLPVTAAFLSLGLVATCVIGRAGVWWMFPTFSGMIAMLRALLQFRERQHKVSERQQLIQTYIDRLMQATTPEERQPILNEMSSQQLLKNIRLSSSDLSDLDLSYADLSKADLSGATLSGANLTGANLTGATLSYATLSYATLHGAILKGANLRGVDLRGADLRQADLSGAFMRGAVLVHAMLASAILQNAQLHGVKLQDADLRDASLKDAILTHVTLPNGVKWADGMDTSCFTDPNHANFWQTDNLYWPVYPPRRP